MHILLLIRLKLTFLDVHFMQQFTFALKYHNIISKKYKYYLCRFHVKSANTRRDQGWL